MYETSERSEMHSKFLLENPKERDALEELGVDGKMILKGI
jgi:hypothetical protein